MRNYENLRRAFFSSTLLLLASSTLCLAQSDSTELVQFYEQNVGYLASDQLAGRGTGTDGERMAAKHLVDFFKSNGLKPVGNSYEQMFPVVTALKPAAGNACDAKIRVLRPGMPPERAIQVPRSFKIGDDYTPLGLSSNGSASGGLAFVGFGISSPADGYDDYEGIDVNGKILVILRGSPDHNDYHGPHNDARRDPHSPLNSHMALTTKVLTAREHGAAGIIFVTPMGDSANVLMPLQADRMAHDLGIPVVQFKRTSIVHLFPPKKESLQQTEERIFASRKPESVILQNAEISITVALEEVTSEARNVIGMIPGTDGSLKSQYVVVGAHFDHLGMGGAGSRYEGKGPAIHHGADDNASGTSMMMSLARYYSQNPPKRPMIFMGFSGEEMGLLGSNYFVKNPTVPLESIVFMLNLDMVGRLQDNKLNIMGTGTSAEFEQLALAAGEAGALEITTNEDGFGPSDHTSFYSHQIPVMMLFTGTHDDYHRPTDTYDKINYGGMAKIFRAATHIVDDIANAADTPHYQKTKSPDKAGSSMAFSVYLGTIPDYSDHPKGLRLSGVRDGGPADEGGMRAGDIIVQFGEVEVKNIYDYTHALGKYKPGDVVDITVLRGPMEDKSVTLKVKMGSKSGGKQ